MILNNIFIFPKIMSDFSSFLTLMFIIISKSSSMECPRCHAFSVIIKEGQKIC